MKKSRWRAVASAVALAITAGAAGVVPADYGPASASPSPLRKRPALSAEGVGAVDGRGMDPHLGLRPGRGAVADGSVDVSIANGPGSWTASEGRGLSWIGDFVNKYFNRGGDGSKGDNGGGGGVVTSQLSASTPPPTRRRDGRTPRPTRIPKTPRPTKKPKTPRPTRRRAPRPDPRPTRKPILLQASPAGTTVVTTTTATTMSAATTTAATTTASTSTAATATATTTKATATTTMMVAATTAQSDTSAVQCYPDLSSLTRACKCSLSPDPLIADEYVFPTAEECCVHWECKATGVGTGPDNSCGSEGEACWYPHIIRGTNDKVCMYDDQYPPEYLDMASFLFDRESDCCSQFPEACEECGFDGEECWYPSLDSYGNKDCVFDGNYPKEYHGNNLFRRSFLFGSEAGCCLHFPHACPSNNGELIEYWFPDMDGASGRADGGVIECVYGNAYPDYMTMPGVVDHHLFETEQECCDLYPCGTNLLDYWYPVVDAEQETIVCVFGNGYPLYMLDRSDGHLFDTEETCYVEWGMEASAPNDVAQKEAPSPMESPKSQPTETSGPSTYMPTWVTTITMAATTTAVAAAVTTSQSGTSPLPCYPNLSSPTKACKCSFSPDPLISDEYVFPTAEECCMHWGCEATDVDTGAANSCGGEGEACWYPHVVWATNAKHCMYDDQYPPEYLDMASFLFGRESDCCSQFPEACEECGLDSEECWYPSLDSDGNKDCVFDGNYPEEYHGNKLFRKSFLFGSEARCCLHFPQACPSNNGELIEYWFPDMDGASGRADGGVIECLYGNTYPDYMTMPGVVDHHLFETEQECCDLYPCGTGLRDYWFPVVDVEQETIICVFGNRYPLYMLDRSNGHLFDTEESCYVEWGMGSAALDDVAQKEAPSPMESPNLQPTWTSEPSMYIPTWVPSITTAATTTAAVAAVTTSQSGTTPVPCYPDLSSLTRSCKCSLSPDPLISDKYVFPTGEECCLHWGCEATDVDTGAPNSCGGEGEACWYPSVVWATNTKHCMYDDQYPPEYLDMASFLFDRESDCCSQFPEACDECGLNREDCWYPSLDSDGNKDCVFDGNYPKDYHGNDLFRKSFLFGSEARCCLYFPQACPSNNGELIEYWFPDMDGASGRADGGVIECVYGNAYPDYMSMPGVVDHHLFETEQECCDLYPCGTNLLDYWFPVVDVEQETIVCVFGNGYPLYMLDRSDGHLFDTEESCYVKWGTCFTLVVARYIAKLVFSEITQRRPYLIT